MGKRYFISFIILTIASVYLLILVGGVVRATGSGMGCPDWPKCFGAWIPPTVESQLPADYKVIFGEKLKGEVEFNAFKTWTEYLNRLLGVLIGVFIFFSFVGSLSFFKSNVKVTVAAFLAFILVGFQGWLGSKVVSTELSPWLVTLHLLIAVVIVLILIYAWINSKEWIIEEDSSLNFSIILLFIVSLSQFILGTRVRESIDNLNHSGFERSTWIENLSGGFYVHIAMAVGLLAIHFWFFKKYKDQENAVVRKLTKSIFVLVFLSFLSGSILGLFEMTNYAQPIHLTLATLILGAQFAIFLVNNKGKLILS